MTTTNLIKLRKLAKNAKTNTARLISADTTIELLDTIEAQAKQIEELNLKLIASFGETQNALEQIEALQPDAERWRAFRSFFVEEPPNAIAGQIERANTPEELDDAIDAARKGNV